MEALLDGLINALEGAPVSTTLSVLHSILSAQKLAPKRSSSDGRLDAPTGDWKSVGLEVAHSVFTLSLYATSDTGSGLLPPLGRRKWSIGEEWEQPPHLPHLPHLPHHEDQHPAHHTTTTATGAVPAGEAGGNPRGNRVHPVQAPVPVPVPAPTHLHNTRAASGHEATTSAVAGPTLVPSRSNNRKGSNCSLYGLENTKIAHDMESALDKDMQDEEQKSKRTSKRRAYALRQLEGQGGDDKGGPGSKITRGLGVRKRQSIVDRLYSRKLRKSRSFDSRPVRRQPLLLQQHPLRNSSGDISKDVPGGHDPPLAEVDPPHHAEVHFLGESFNRKWEKFVRWTSVKKITHEEPTSPMLSYVRQKSPAKSDFWLESPARTLDHARSSKFTSRTLDHARSSRVSRASHGSLIPNSWTQEDLTKLEIDHTDTSHHHNDPLLLASVDDMEDLKITPRARSMDLGGGGGGEGDELPGGTAMERSLSTNALFSSGHPGSGEVAGADVGGREGDEDKEGDRETKMKMSSPKGGGNGRRGGKKKNWKRRMSKTLSSLGFGAAKEDSNKNAKIRLTMFAEDDDSDTDEDNRGSRTTGGMSEQDQTLPSRVGPTFNIAAVANEAVRKKILVSLAEEVHSLKVQGQRASNEDRWMLHPASPWRQMWSLVLVVALLYELLVLPVRVAFDDESFHFPQPSWWMQQSVLILFWLDIALNCCTGVIVKRSIKQEEEDESKFRTEEKLSYKMKDIMSNYLRGWFWVDVTSAIPWEYVADRLEYSEIIPFTERSVLAFCLIHLLKLSRFFSMKSVHEMIRRLIPPAVLSLASMVFTVSVLAHYVACAFYYIGIVNQKHGDGTWLEKYLGDDPVEDNTLITLYVTSIYWAVTTMTTVGYGDIVPVTRGEKTLGLCVMYIGVATMSAITGKLTTLLAQFGAQEASIRSKVEAVKSYCKYRSLPVALRKSVTEYFEVRAAQQVRYNETQILQELSPSLKAQVVCYIFRNVIESVPFLRGCSDLFLSAVLCCMEPQLFSPADIIIQKGQREAAMYILAKGRAGILSATGRVVKEIHDGEFFGEIGLFFGVRRTATICSITFCDLFKLHQDQFIKIQDTYPEMKQRIKDQAEEMFNNRITCFLCGQSGHISIQCKAKQEGADELKGSETPDDAHPRQASDSVIRGWNRPYDPFNDVQAPDNELTLAPKSLHAAVNRVSRIVKEKGFSEVSDTFHKATPSTVSTISKRGVSIGGWTTPWKSVYSSQESEDK